jgi:glycerol-3-phosphate acyltransferase PlsX
MMSKVAIDAMGGDNMPQAAVTGALAAAREGIEVILVGDEARLRPLLGEGQGVTVEHAADVIGMEEHASDVRRRRDSSVMRTVALVKEGRAQAAVSLGHSGATMAAALLVLGRLPGVDRPAILATVPAATGFVALLDVGANADCRPAHLQQFAVMGSVYARAFLSRSEPSVGLMSIGEEPEKGNELVLAAHGLLRETRGISFYGNVEGRDLFRGTTDVVVTDGFTGNVMLKLAEGEARQLFSWIRTALTEGPLLTRFGALLVRKAVRGVAQRLDPGEYGAQPLLGVRGNVFIGHGSADARAVHNALRTADRAVRAGLLQKLASGLEGLSAATGQA